MPIECNSHLFGNLETFPDMYHLKLESVTLKESQ